MKAPRKATAPLPPRRPIVRGRRLHPEDGGLYDVDVTVCLPVRFHLVAGDVVREALRGCWPAVCKVVVEDDDGEGVSIATDLVSWTPERDRIYRQALVAMLRIVGAAVWVPYDPMDLNV